MSGSIAATNKDLRAEMKEGRFREDLFFRLNVVPLHSPALRERKEDIPILIGYFARTFCEENNFRPKTFSAEAMAALIEHSWKGNVRELRNVVERLIILTEKDVIDKKDLPEQFREEKEVDLPDEAGVRTLKEFREIAEKEFILAKLRSNGWNISQTAQGDRHAEEQPLQETRAIWYKDNCWSRRGGCSFPRYRGRRGGKSELHRAGWSLTATPGDRGKVPQKTHRPPGTAQPFRGARVKWRGKSSPSRW